jgi:hypothetical protein
MITVQAHDRKKPVILLSSFTRFFPPRFSDRLNRKSALLSILVVNTDSAK